jgi:HD-GYP domain-containing protein (c-di-GMP phosphodiesterase class II)
VGNGADGVRLAELVATLSYAADLGLGQPVRHCTRKTLIALRMADQLGVTDAEREATFYTGLLMNVYCHADASEQASWFGDDIAFKADAYTIMDLSTPQAVALLLRRVSSTGSGLDRARRVAALPHAGKRMVEFLTTHSSLASQFAAQVGLDPPTAAAINHAYEQWDGKGVPDHLRGEAISRPARLVQLAGAAEVFGRRGVDTARRVVRRHRATNYDPALVDLFCDQAMTLLDGLDDEAEWDALLDGQPSLHRRVDGDELDRVLQALADLVDLKSPHLAGHSRGVANLVAEAARHAGLSSPDVTVLRRAGLLHDLGRLGVSNAILDKPRPLTAAETERVRMHPYLTDRMLARITSLTASREVAARHHERLDGSGYPRGLSAGALSPGDRLLAAADVYHALTEPRPHRPPLPPDQAARTIQAEVKAGRLDGDAVSAVLAAAGHRAPARRGWPGGLTGREVEVLVLLARGRVNKEIARQLGVTPKTVSNHIEHIYAKLSISSRAAATLFATQHSLIGTFEADR